MRMPQFTYDVEGHEALVLITAEHRIALYYEHSNFAYPI